MEKIDLINFGDDELKSGGSETDNMSIEEKKIFSEECYEAIIESQKLNIEVHSLSKIKTQEDAYNHIHSLIFNGLVEKGKDSKDAVVLANKEAVKESRILFMDKYNSKYFRTI